MNIGKAIGIFKNIDNTAGTDAEKIEAINEVVAMETHNGITKADTMRALNWAMRYCFFLECQNINLKKIKDFYEKNDEPPTDPETENTHHDTHAEYWRNLGKVCPFEDKTECTYYNQGLCSKCTYCNP